MTVSGGSGAGVRQSCSNWLLLWVLVTFCSPESSARNTAAIKPPELFLHARWVVKPNPQEISAVLKVCNQHKIPVTPRGARVQVWLGAVCQLRRIGAFAERFNKILNIDELESAGNRWAGCYNAKFFQNAVKAKPTFSIRSGRGSCFWWNLPKLRRIPESQNMALRAIMCWIWRYFAPVAKSFGRAPRFEKTLPI